MSAVRNNYKLPKQAYGLYRSASMHVTQKMTVPIFAYMIPLIIVFVGYFAYKSYHSVMDRANPKQETTLIAEEKTSEKTLTPDKASQPQPAQPTQPVLVPQPVRTVNYVVSDQVDWSKVGACVANETQCICYGQKAERLVLPNETCRTGAKHGWPGKQL